LIPVVARLTLFWWLVFTVIAFGNDPLGVARFIWHNLSEFGHYIGMVGFVGLASGAVVAWGYYAKKIWSLKRLQPSKSMGLSTPIGKIPLPNPPVPRIKSEKERLPIEGEHILAWLKSQTTEIAPEKEGDAPRNELTPH